MRQTWLYMVAWAIGCGGCGSSNSRAADAPPSIDAAADAPVAPDAATICDPMAIFDRPRPISELSATPRSLAAWPTLTADERSVYFADFNGGLYAAHRDSITESFEPPNLLPVVNSNPSFGFEPAVSADQRELWFASRDAAGLSHLYVATRMTTSDDFTSPVLDSNVNAAGFGDESPFLTADGQQLWFSSSRPPARLLSWRSIWHVTREGRSFTTPRLEAAFTGSDTVSFSNPVLSADRRTIYLNRSDAAQRLGQVWRSHRATGAEAFPAPAPVNELASGSDNIVPGWLSADNCRLYLTVLNVSNTYVAGIYVAVRHP